MDKLLLYGLPSLVAVLCYLNSLKGQLVYDDIPAIQNNPDLKPENNIYNLLYDDYWGKLISDNTSHKSYRPVTVLTFRLNYRLHGLDPYGFHLLNVVLHGIATCLVVRLCVTMVFRRDKQALLTALVFAVHPIHTEAVASVVGRADVLSAIFFILTLLVYQQSLCAQSGSCVIYLSASCLMAGTSMLCKEQGITSLAVCILLPISCIDYDARLRPKPKWNFRKRNCDAVIIGWISVLLMLRVSVMRALPVFLREDNPASFESNLSARMMTHSYIYCLNGLLMIYPMHLCHDWSYSTISVIHNFTDPRNTITVVFILCGALMLYKAIFSQSKKERCILKYGLLLIILPFLPASNVFYRVGFVIAERILYIPSIGYCILLVYGVTKLEKLYGCQIGTLLVVMCLALAAKTVMRNQDWTDREHLAKSGILTFPHNAKLQYNYANLMRDKGLLDEAIDHYKEAIRLWPEYASAHNNVATLLILTNGTASLEHLNLAVRYNPAHANSYFNLAAYEWLQTNYSESIKYIEKALAIDPSCVRCQTILDLGYIKLREDSTTQREFSYTLEHHNFTDDLSENYTDALRHSVNNLSTDEGTHSEVTNDTADTILNIAAYRASEGTYDKAIDILNNHKDSIKGRDTKARFYFMLGECYKDQGQLPHAIQSFTMAVELVPKHTNAHHNLAVAYHIMRNLTEASHHYRRALELDPSNQLLLQNYHKFKETERLQSKLSFSIS